MVRNLLIIIVIFVSPIVVADKCRTDSACFKPHITWKWDSNYRLYDVCSNYASGHWKYRHCRGDAQRLFKQKCKDAKKGERVTDGATKKLHERDVKIYCSTFRP